MRVFIAAEIPESLRTTLVEASQVLKLQDAHQAVRWVEPENYHITLSFLGEQTNDSVKQIKVALEELLGADHQLILTTKTLQLFPLNKNPQLVAVLLEPHAGLNAIKQQIDERLTKYDLFLSQRQFVPHITLGRLGRRQKQVTYFEPKSFEHTTTINKITLFESVLVAGKIKYIRLDRGC